MSSEITALCERHGSVVPMRDGTCPWCDGPTRERIRRGGKPKGKYRKLSDEQVRAAHTLYVARRLSLRALGQLLYERFGYSSAASCAQALQTAFSDLGLPRRERIEATVEASTTHGLRPREAQTKEQRERYNALRRDRRDHRPLCRGSKTTYPGKGRPCQRPAQAGSEYCISHDPARKDEVARRLEDARGWVGL